MGAVQVFPITNAAGTGTPTIGAVIPAGSNLRAVGADRTSNIWLAGSTPATAVYVIAKGSTTVTTVTGLTYAAGAQALTGGPLLRGFLGFRPSA